MSDVSVFIIYPDPQPQSHPQSQRDYDSGYLVTFGIWKFVVQEMGPSRVLRVASGRQARLSVHRADLARALKALRLVRVLQTLVRQRGPHLDLHAWRMEDRPRTRVLGRETVFNSL